MIKLPTEAKPELKPASAPALGCCDALAGGAGVGAATGEGITIFAFCIPVTAVNISPFMLLTAAASADPTNAGSTFTAAGLNRLVVIKLTRASSFFKSA